MNACDKTSLFHAKLFCEADTDLVFLYYYCLSDVSKLKHDFYIWLNGKEECVNKRIYAAGSRNFDISCDNPVITSSIVTRGLVSDFTCFTFVSYGRYTFNFSCTHTNYRSFNFATVVSGIMYTCIFSCLGRNL